MISRVRNKIKNFIKHRILKEKGPDHIPKSIIKKHLPVNAIIIDAGAHYGDDSVEFAKLLPKSTIYAFEPMPDIYDGLVSNAKPYSNIKCERFALNNYSGDADFYVSSGTSDASSSILKPELVKKYHPTVEFNDVIKVQCLLLDEWLSLREIPHVDLMWLDLQGNELNVLASSQLIWEKLKAVHIEVNEEPLYENSPVYEDVVKFFQERGFDINYSALYPNSKVGNLFFVKRQTNGK